jgi:hypothetical protein
VQCRSSALTVWESVVFFAAAARSSTQSSTQPWSRDEWNGADVEQDFKAHEQKAISIRRRGPERLFNSSRLQQCHTRSGAVWTVNTAGWQDRDNQLSKQQPYPPACSTLGTAVGRQRRANPEMAKQANFGCALSRERNRDRKES